MTNRELAEALRLCATGRNCEPCQYYNPQRPFAYACLSALQRQAADALENSETHIAALQREIEKLRGQLEMEKKPQWVSVKERMPETIPCSAGTAYSEAVNVLTSGRKVLAAIYDGHGFIADADFWDAVDEDITHWASVLMPLPEPPSTEGVE